MDANRKYSLTAGFLYLCLVLTKIFTQFVVRSNLINWNDAAATAQNILTSEGLFRFGFIADLIGEVCFLILVLFLYRLLKPVNKTHALVMAGCIIVNVAILSLNMVHQYAVLLLLKGSSGYLAVFESDQIVAQALFHLRMWGAGHSIASVFYSLWLFPLGYLVLKSDSGRFSRILGWWLMITCCALLFNFFTRFLVPEFSRALIFNVTHAIDISEIVFCFWLLIKGVTIKK